MMCESSSEARVKMHVKWWRSYIYDPGFLTGPLHQHHHKINIDYMITHSFTGVWQGLRNSFGVQSSAPECQMVKNKNTNILFWEHISEILNVFTYFVNRNLFIVYWICLTCSQLLCSVWTTNTCTWGGGGGGLFYWHYLKSNKQKWYTICNFLSLLTVSVFVIVVFNKKFSH